MTSFENLKKNDVRLRNSIVEVYRRKRFYCGRAIDVNTLELDHIIPVNGRNEVYPDERVDFDAYMEELKLDGFTIDSLINYLPSCGSCNKKKGNDYFTVANLRYFHEYARKKKKKLIEFIEKMTYKALDEDKVMFNQKLVRQYESNNELLVDKKVIDSGFYIYYINGMGQVRLDAYLPNDIDDELSCLLSFTEKGIENCMLTFNEDDIDKIFFSGYKKGVSTEQPYIVFIDGTQVCFQFPRIRFNVHIKAAEQLALLFDDLYEEYNRQLSKLINTVDGSDFIQESRGKYKLIELPIWIWKLLKEFTYEHDYLNGDTEWDMFDSIGGEDTIYVFKNHKLNYNADVLVVLKAKKTHNNNVEVIWNRGFLGNYNDKMDNFDNCIKWTVRYTHDWLLDDWIPYVIFLYEQRKARNLLISKFFRGKYDFQEYKRTFLPREYNIISLAVDE